MNDDILQRISHLYASISTIEEKDPSKMKPTVIVTDKSMAVFQDFRSGLTDDELSNQASMMIYNIANLRDHLRRWAPENGHDKAKISQAIKDCFELQVMRDLSNNHRHGYPLDHSSSKRNPRLTEVTREMRMQTQSKNNSMIGMILGPNGPQIIGDGTAKAVVTGDVVDKDGNRIGDLYDMASKAVEAWESLLIDFGLLSAKANS